MDDVFVGSLMSTPVRTVGPEESVQSAARSLRDRGIGSLVVLDDSEQLLGILTATDVVRLAAEGADATSQSVAEYMSSDVVTTTINTPVREVADLIVAEGFHHLPVVDGEGGVIGILTTTDLTAYVSGVVEPSPER